ncbi:MAG: hypothetical protein WBC21_04345 [Minisyncoccales bacterium]
MEIYFTKSFEKDYKDLSAKIQKQLDKQLNLLLGNINHPSLRVKKIKGYSNIWEGRISKSYRFTFQIKRDYYFMRRAGSHSIFSNP